MKKTFFLGSILLILSCSDDNNGDNNQFLPPSNVNYQINLNLPQYVNLRSPGNNFIDRTENGSIRGIIIYNLNNTQYSAFELSDPNHSPNNCSAIEVENGTSVTATCGCDDENSYDIITGQKTSGNGFGLRRYNVQKEGNTLFISN
jgi:hypothetical protein